MQVVHVVHAAEADDGSVLEVSESIWPSDRVAIIDSGKIISLGSPDKLIDELVATGFERPKEVKKANLEDVFINLTGHALREE